MLGDTRGSRIAADEGSRAKSLRVEPVYVNIICGKGLEINNICAVRRATAAGEAR